MPHYFHYNPVNMAMLIRSWIGRILPSGIMFKRRLYSENRGVGDIDIRVGEPI